MNTLVAMGAVVGLVVWKESDRSFLLDVLGGLCLLGAFALMALRFKGVI